MNPTVFLGLGSNLGDREAAIDAAARALLAHGFLIGTRSSLWHTQPVGGPPQGWFLNAVLGGRTALSPEALLHACLAVESELGRVRRELNGPRTIDIDLLLYAERKIDQPGLTVPHPRLQERRFVLEPLAEIAPEVRHPALGRTIGELLADCEDRSTCERLSPRTGSGWPSS